MGFPGNVIEGGGGGGVADHGALTGLADDDHSQYSLLSSQAGAPSSTPGRVGEINIDTTDDNVYVATDTSASTDWSLLSKSNQILLMPNVLEPDPGAAGPTKDVYITPTNGVGRIGWFFAANEKLYFNLRVPKGMTAPTMTVCWTNQTGASASDTCIWGIQLLSAGDNDPIEAALGSQVTSTDTLHADGDIHIDTTGSITAAGTLAAGEMLFGVIERTGGTMTEDGILLWATLDW